MGKLYVVPTPIGNLGDITLRALEVLKSVDIILAEDTRQTGKLLKHYDIGSPMKAYHKFNERQSVEAFINQIKSGKNIALVSDGGTPLISDPGHILVSVALEENVEIESLPGATALIPALVNSGFDTRQFYFAGFLPHKKGRQTQLKDLVVRQETLILYESPHRLLKLFSQMAEHFQPDRLMAVNRELTKMFEEVVRGDVAQLTEHFEKKAPKGEIVVVIEGLAEYQARKSKESSSAE